MELSCSSEYLADAKVIKFSFLSAYIVERGLILEPYEVDSKTNEITAIPAFIEQMALKGVVKAGGCHQHPKKTAHTIIDSSNHYVHFTGNQSGLLTAVSATFQPQETSFQINKGPGED